MGNNQSNTRTKNYKVFKIVGREDNSGWFRCYLDDYFPYSNGNYKHMDFENDTFRNIVETICMAPPTPLDRFTGSRPEYSYLGVGDYIRIDLNMTSDYNSGENFSRYSSVETVGSESTTESGDTIISALGGWANEVMEARERYNAATMYARQESRIQEWHFKP